MSADFGRTARDYARYRAGFPDSLFGRLSAFGIGDPGQRVLDLGTGTGTLARGFARRGCEVTALDPAPELMEEAKHLDREAGVSVRYMVAKAEETSLTDGAFEVVSAGIMKQVWAKIDTATIFKRSNSNSQTMALRLPRA